jgi:adenylate cyclase
MRYLLFKRTSMLSKSHRLTLLFIFGFIAPFYAQTAIEREKMAEIKADSLANMGEYKDAGQELFRLAEWLSEQDSIRLAGKYYKKAGLYFSEEEKLSDQAHSAFDKAATIFKKLNLPVEEAYIFLKKAICFHQNYDYPNALEEYLKAQHQFEQLNYKKGEAEVLMEIGVFYRDCENMPAAFEAENKALAIHENLKDSSNLYYEFFNLGMFNDETKNYDKALEYYFKALPLSTANENILLNNISNTYKNQKNYSKALVYAQNALKSAIADEDEESLPIIYSTLCEINILLGQNQKALEYGKKSLRGAESIDNLEILKIAHHNLSEIYEKLGKTSEALFYHKSYIALKDSISNDEKDREIDRRISKFEYEKKQKDQKDKQEKLDLMAKTELGRQKMMLNVFIGGFAFMLLIAGLIFRSYRREQHTKSIIQQEKQKSDDLLLNILPAQAAEELKTKGFSDARLYAHATVLFTDFKDFTVISEIVTPAALVKMIDFYFSEFDRITVKYNIEKIKTVGDAYVCANGLNNTETDRPHNMVLAAMEFQKFSLQQQKKCEAEGIPFFQCRVGLHTGPVVAGVVGIKKFTYDIWGDTVNVAARMEQHGEPGKINVSEATYLLIKDQFSCEYRGKILAKNKGEVSMYFVNGTHDTIN